MTLGASIRENDGHSPGTATTPALEPQGRETRQQDCLSWPRLLDERLGAAYLGVSVWTFRELINAGDIAPVKVPRPRTAKAMRTRPAGDVMRRKLVDRLDLDRLVDSWKASA